MPKDRVTQTHQSYGFVEYQSEEDADYAIKVLIIIVVIIVTLKAHLPFLSFEGRIFINILLCLLLYPSFSNILLLDFKYD